MTTKRKGLRLDMIPLQVLGDIREYLGAERNSADHDVEIIRMSGKEAFQHYCEWNGIIGYSDTLWDTTVIRARINSNVERIFMNSVKKPTTNGKVYCVAWHDYDTFLAYTLCAVRSFKHACAKASEHYRLMTSWDTSEDAVQCIAEFIREGEPDEGIWHSMNQKYEISYTITVVYLEVL